MTTKSEIAKSFYAHLRIVRLMSEPTRDYDTEALRRDSLDYEDYRDATVGGCGFPWEDNEDDDTDPISRDAYWHLGQVAFGLVADIVGWGDAPASDYSDFLTECGFPEEQVKRFVPEGIAPQDILGY
jgi:hypothetical protein